MLSYLGLIQIWALIPKALYLYSHLTGNKEVLQKFMSKTNEIPYLFSLGHLQIRTAYLGHSSQLSYTNLWQEELISL